MRVKKKKKSTLQKKFTVSVGSNLDIDIDVYVQPESKKYVLFKDAHEVIHSLDCRIEELSELLTECVPSLTGELKERVKGEIKWRE